MIFLKKSKNEIRRELRDRCRKRCKGVELCGNCKRYQRYYKKYGEPLDPVDCLEDVAVQLILERTANKA